MKVIYSLVMMMLMGLGLFAVDANAASSIENTLSLTTTKASRFVVDEHTTSTIATEEDLVGQNYTNLIRIGDVLDVFNVKRIGSMWSLMRHHLNANCSKDLQEYLEALETAEMWALKSNYHRFYK